MVKLFQRRNTDLGGRAEGGEALPPLQASCLTCLPGYKSGNRNTHHLNIVGVMSNGGPAASWGDSTELGKFQLILLGKVTRLKHIWLEYT